MISQPLKALVCGSTQGIGLAIAQKLAIDGFSVVLTARNKEKLENVVQTLAASHGQKHHYFVSDFSKPETLKIAIDAFVKNNGPVHVLINNTGGPKGGPIVSAETSEFLAAFNQHLICNHILMQALVPGMKAVGFGRIVNIISTSVKQPLPNLGVSNTIRGAVANWSKTLANELAPFGITVNNVLPGATNTQRLTEIAKAKAEKTGESVADILAEMGQESPMQRIAEPQEIAAAVAFLASPSASYINGINVPVDGGRTKSL
ncbi:MAG: SDR family oxidoreductase [Sphingomonadales bacterium]|nr:SDR family oxidoreductase [Sphingomonadales bacterium]